MKKILILDGNNACWRLMKTLPVLTAGGVAIQMVYGFLRLVKNNIDMFDPNVVLVCWDSGHAEHRMKLFSQYKSNRDHEKDDESAREFKSFLNQVNVIQELLKNLNVAQASFEQSEADDLISIACDSLSGRKIIISADKDMLQLVDDEVQVWSPIKFELYTSKNFKKKTELSPEQYLQMRALLGDKTDNIPGVALGFGEVTAKELLMKYRDIDTLFSSSVEKKVIKKGNRYSLLYQDGVREKVFRNLLLMDLKAILHTTKAKKMAEDISEECKHRKKVNRAEIKKFFTEKKFVSLLADFPKWITSFESLDTEQ